MPGLDPFKLAEVVEKGVYRVRGGVPERRYYRFRGGKWYGGIATGDVVGCNLRCKFCWSWRYSFYTDKGWFESPLGAFEKMEGIARRNKYKYVRLSGGEPTIGAEHLFELIKLFNEETGLEFILETNGLLIGRDPALAKRIAGFERVAVRVSFKGCNEEEFERLTGADRKFYEYQLRALENLINYGLSPCREVYPAVMLSFSTEESYRAFRERLAEVHELLPECIDEEYVILYPHVADLLRRNGLRPYIAFRPDNIPEYMI